MTLVSVSTDEEASEIRQAFFHLPAAQQISHRYQWIGILPLDVSTSKILISILGLYQDSIYFEHNQWLDGLLSRYLRPGAPLLDLYARCVHWDLVNDIWSDEVACSDEIAFMCMQPGNHPFYISEQPSCPK
jgi:hypothetical protein